MTAVLLAAEAARENSPMGGLVILLVIGFTALKIGSVKVGGERLDDGMSGAGLILAAVVVLGFLAAIARTKAGVDVMEYVP